jgi:hypothetical protein
LVASSFTAFAASTDVKKRQQSPMAPESEVFAGEGFSVLVQVGTGPMQGRSSLDFELRRVFNPAQGVTCFLGKAEKLVCCAIK